MERPDIMHDGVLEAFFQFLIPELIDGFFDARGDIRLRFRCLSIQLSYRTLNIVSKLSSIKPLTQRSGRHDRLHKPLCKSLGRHDWFQKLTHRRPRNSFRHLSLSVDRQNIFLRNGAEPIRLVQDAACFDQRNERESAIRL